MIARCCVWLCLMFAPHFLMAAEPEIPAALQDWQGWVLHGEGFRQCPFFASQNPDAEGNFACAVPGALRVQVTGTNANLALNYQIYNAGYVVLASAQNSFPEAVMVDGNSAVVLAPNGVPALWLDVGNHEITYALDLTAGPDSLSVPSEIRVVSLNLNGREVFPLAREGETVWLERKVEAAESDSLEITVHRLWTDSVPQRLSTRIELHVAGKAREIRLGPAWPEGQELVSVGGQLAVVVEPGRMLRVQATAGSYSVNLETRSLTHADALSFTFPQGEWPDHEVWSFRADHRLRVVDVRGASPIDPAMGEVPGEWRDLPAFAISSGEGISLTQRSRGLGDDANRMQLSRELWLDFDGAGYTVQDHLSGRMRQGFRLDLAPPYALLSASERAEPLLVTAAESGEARGFEVRYPTLNVDASSRLPRAGGFPAHGWSERLDSMSSSLHLPPGYRLLYASGVDRAPQAWFEQWNIYSVFIAAFAVALAWRLGGYGLAGAVGVFAVLAAHEVDAPHYSLIALLIFTLGWRSLNAGRLRQLLAVIALACALCFAWVSLPFVLAQARYALHPQLVDVGLLGASSNVMEAQFQDVQTAPAESMPMAPPPPPAPPAMSDSEGVGSRSNMAQGQMANIRNKRASVMERYAKDAVVQAGIGRPTWRWSRVDLVFDGPVDTDQQIGLWLTPPLATAIWRFAIVIALAAIALALLRVMRWRLPRSPVVAALLLALVAPGLAAQAPDSSVLETLKQRLTEAPECAPACARLAQGSLRVDGGRLTLDVDVHAAERVLVPLPLDDSALSEISVRLDGKTVGLLGSEQAPGAAWIAVERGVHRLSLSGRVHGDRLALDFAMAPARLEVDIPGWNATGLRDGRLLAVRLELVREAPSEVVESGTQARVPVAPYVRIEREISLDLDWTVLTRVVRLAPLEGGFSVRLPLLPGEQPTDPSLRVSAGVAEISLQPGQNYAEINSRLPRAESIVLSAPALADRAEVWRVVVGPSLSMRSSGVPVSEPAAGIDEDDVWQHEFNPLPGEQLTLTISRPAAVPGATLVADSVEMSSEIGTRSRTHNLTMNLRATQGGNHALTLPADAELMNLSIDGRALSVKPDKGVLTIPIKPGQQSLALSWREDLRSSWITRTPALDLGLDAANVSLRIALPSDRWILHVTGPAVGPAVLYWSGLIALLAIGYGLGRSGRALIDTRAWMLLVLGFSTLSYGPFFLIAVAFIALDARRRYPPIKLQPVIFNTLQIVLAGISALAFVFLIGAIPVGLLGSPDMHLSGGYGNYGQLAWLADRATGELPVASVYSLPMWVYKALMLSFALWLASALVNWIKLAWNALIAGDGWMALRQTRPPLAPLVADPPKE